MRVGELALVGHDGVELIIFTMRYQSLSNKRSNTSCTPMDIVINPPVLTESPPTPFVLHNYHLVESQVVDMRLVPDLTKRCSSSKLCSGLGLRSRDVSACGYPIA